MKTTVSKKKVIITAVISALIFSISVMGVYAFFSTRAVVYTNDGNKEYASVGMSMNLLFDKLVKEDLPGSNGEDKISGVISTPVLDSNGQPVLENGKPKYTYITFDEEAEWGSAANPYIISDIRHLQNLSVLQEIGYFEERYIVNNYDTKGDRSTYNSSAYMPYFLVCNPDGTPATIDGTDNIFSPIGTDEYPFVGYVGGAFNHTKEASIPGDGLNSDESVIYNLNICTDTDIIDVGLFGTIGYLGYEKAVNDQNQFKGEISTVRDLVLYDVQISVNKPSIVSKAFDVATHLFSFTGVSGADANKVPKENHHIGILAGHVEYANVNYISVYYSDDDVVAIDLLHTAGATDEEHPTAAVPNYSSTTGIIGFLYNMNPDIDASQNVGVGSGVSSSDISLGSGVGTGGGLASGTGRGYITAAGIADKFPYSLKAGVDNKPYIIKNAVDNTGKPLCTEWVRKRLLWGTQNTGRYYFYDGVFTFALSSEKDTIEDTWITDSEGVHPDEFVIGPDEDSAWRQNVSEGYYAKIAYLKQITNQDELNAATDAGKTLMIMYKADITGDGNLDAYMMTLSSQSADAGDGDDRYTTSGNTVAFASAETVESIIDAYKSMPDKIVPNEDDFSENLVNSLKAGNLAEYDLLNLGTSADEEILSNIQEKYKINIAYETDTSQLYSYDNGDYAYVNSEGLRKATVEENFYYYTKKKNSGLISTYDITYYYNENSWTNTWNRFDANWTPNNFNSNTTINPLARIGDINGNNQAYVLYYENGVYYLSEKNKSYPVTFLNDGKNPIIPYGEAIKTYLAYDTKTNQYYIMNGQAKGEVVTNVAITMDEETGISTYSGYTSSQTPVNFDSNSFVIIEQMDYYKLAGIDSQSKATNMLKIVCRVNKFLGFIVSRNYSIWCGPIGAVPISGLEKSEKATIIFNQDGTCNIRYTYSMGTRYVNYGGSYFNGVTTPSATSNLCIYTLEGITNIDYGHVTYDTRTEPVDAASADTNSTAIKFMADEYVLWPNQTTNQGNTITGATYSVKSLQELAKTSTDGMNTKTGWQNDQGQPLIKTDLVKKFHMSSKTQWSAVVNILNGSIMSDGILRAPIGTLGVEANIPQGTVAFRINKSGENKIRVIVAVPQSDYSAGERESDQNLPALPNEDTYFGVWQVEAAGSSLVQTFSRDSALEKFLVPQSFPYNPQTKAGEAEHYTVTYNDKNYRMYFNGDRLLVAYEFTVTDEGVYILGTTGAPMEIVYFSADATASSGRDGTSGSLLGSIDFVYSYNGEVVTVKDNMQYKEEGESENYNNYYATLCLMFTDNARNLSNDTGTYSFRNINDMAIKVRRFVDGKSKIDLSVSSSDDDQQTYLQMIRYAVSSDDINYTYSGTR